MCRCVNHQPLCITRIRYAAVADFLWFCSHPPHQEKRKDFSQFLGSLTVRMKFFYEVLNLVVIAPLPMETTVKTSFCLRQHEPRASSVLIPGRTAPACLCQLLPLKPWRAKEVACGIRKAVKGPAPENSREGYRTVCI